MFSVFSVCVYMHVLGEWVHKVQGCKVSCKSPPAAPLGWGSEISICFPHTVIITTVNFVLLLSCQWSILAVVTGLLGLWWRQNVIRTSCCVTSGFPASSVCSKLWWGALWVILVAMVIWQAGCALCSSVGPARLSLGNLWFGLASPGVSGREIQAPSRLLSLSFLSFVFNYSPHSV